MPLCALKIAKFSRAKSNLRQIEFGVTDLIAILKASQELIRQPGKMICNDTAGCRTGTRWIGLSLTC